jgi:hypothetical protein
VSAPTPRSAPTPSCTHPCHHDVPLFPAAAPTPTRVTTSPSLSHAAAPPAPHGSPPGIFVHPELSHRPPPPTSVPGPMPAAKSLNKRGAQRLGDHAQLGLGLWLHDFCRAHLPRWICHPTEEAEVRRVETRRLRRNGWRRAWSMRRSSRRMRRNGWTHAREA